MKLFQVYSENSEDQLGRTSLVMAEDKDKAATFINNTFFKVCSIKEIPLIPGGIVYDHSYVVEMGS